MADIPLTPEQEVEADTLAQRLQVLVGEELRSLARLLASKPDAQLLGRTEFQLRDRLHDLGARILETALDERKKGGTRGRA